MSQNTAELSVSEIKDWPSFIRSLQAGLSSPASQRLFDAEARLLIEGIRPGMVTDDGMMSVVNELNGLLTDKAVMSRVRNSARLSGDTMAQAANYEKTRSGDDLKWLNRSILSDVFPPVPRKQKKGAGLKKLSCTTCHEMYQETDEQAKAPGQAALCERDVMDCFSEVIDGKKTAQECAEMAAALKKYKIAPYGPLKNFVQRSNPAELSEYLIAVSPENPYTFKPLLKRLVCVECHDSDRKVDKVNAGKGKMRKIPIFYGVGNGKYTQEWASEVLKR
jgi:hypothetical protein